VFTTGGSENPTLTIVTLAIRQADYIAEPAVQADPVNGAATQLSWQVISRLKAALHRLP